MLLRITMQMPLIYVKNGEAQVISSIADDYNIVDQLDLQVTLPYMDINTSAITQGRHWKSL